MASFHRDLFQMCISMNGEKKGANNEITKYHKDGKLFGEAIKAECRDLQKDVTILND